MYPFSFCAAGLAVPQFLIDIDFRKALKALPASERKRDYSKALAYLFFILSYGLGFVLFMLPDFYQN